MSFSSLLESESEVAQSCPTLCDPMDAAYQAPQSMEFSRQEYCSGLPFPSPGDLPDPGIEPRSPAGRRFTIWATREACDSIDCSIPGFSVLHYLPEFAQIHIHWVVDVIQPSHPLSPSCTPALNLSQHQGLFQWLGSSHQVAKLLELQFQHQSFWRRKQTEQALESRIPSWNRLWTLSYKPSIYGNDIPTGKADPSGWKSPRAYT